MSRVTRRAGRRGPGRAPLPAAGLIDPGRSGPFVRRLADVTIGHLRDVHRSRVYSGAGVRVLERLFSAPPPARGRAPQRILAEFRRRILRHSLQISHPRIFGLLHPVALPVAAAADLAGALMNQSTDAWKAGPAATQVDLRLIRWMNDRIGYPRGAFGVFTSGGGVANILALKVARDRVLGPRARTRGIPSRLSGRLRVYASEEAHFSVPRALDLIGLGSDALCPVPVDRNMKMRPDRLEDALRRDRRSGMIAMAVVSTAGTTNTGNIDPLEDIAEVARRFSLYHHVDAAYGGAALVSDRYRHLLAGLGLADSVTIDPHKWLFQPISLGGLFVRDGRPLNAAFRTEPDYLRKDLEREAGRLDFYHYSLEGSRPFRGLKLWLTLQAIGTEGLAALVDRTMELTGHLVREIDRRESFERFPAPVELTTCCVRFLPPWARSGTRARLVSGAGRERLNRAQLHVQHTLERQGYSWFPPILLGGAVFFRFGIFNYLTTPADITAVLDRIEAVGSSPDAV